MPLGRAKWKWVSGNCGPSWADIVAFDMDGIQDMATYEKPNNFPRGIEHVIVNGEIAVEKGRHQRKLAGKVLRGTNRQPTRRDELGPRAY